MHKLLKAKQNRKQYFGIMCTNSVLMAMSRSSSHGANETGTKQINLQLHEPSYCMHTIYNSGLF